MSQEESQRGREERVYDGDSVVAPESVIESQEESPQSESGDAEQSLQRPPRYESDFIEDQRFILQETRLMILQQILASESGALSIAELDWRIQDLTDSTLRSHVSDLASRGSSGKKENDDDNILALLEVPSGERTNDMPDYFYAVTEYGVELLKSVNMYQPIGILYQSYKEVERPENIEAIEQYEQRRSPDWF